MATGLLARYLKSSGRRTVTQKIVQTGDKGISADIQLHRRLADMELLPEDISGMTCRYVFKFPASPHLAASLENSIIDISRIDADTRQLEKNYQCVLIEGAGGLQVPLNDDYLISDFLTERRYPVILVSSPRLGSINHTLLSLELASRRGIRVTGIVYNIFNAAVPEITAATRSILCRYLTKYGFPATIIDLPFFSPDNPPTLDFSQLITE